MGSLYSKVGNGRDETVSRCKARKRYAKQFVTARHSLAAAHSIFLRSLRATGSALLNFASAEATRHHNPPPPPPPMSPISSETTTSSSVPPPPPPPPMSRSEQREEATTAAASGVAPSIGTATTPPSSSADSELALVVSRDSGKDLVGIIKELDDYFSRAAGCGTELSKLLEVPATGFSYQINGGKVYDNGFSLSTSVWTLGCSSQRWGSFGEGKIGSNTEGRGIGIGSHCSTVERLYSWEKKLFQEVKNAGKIKVEIEKKVQQLRKLELKRADYVKTAKTKKQLEKLESQMTVASQAIETTSGEITKLRETELYPQLLKLVKGLMCMWRSMYECHQVQKHIVEQLKYLNKIQSLEPTSEVHRQSTLQLEHETQQWHLSFCNLVKSQHDYVQALMGWLRLGMFQFDKSSSRIESRIYSLCEDWSQAVDRIPDKVASEGIKSFLTVIHAIMVQQEAEQRQKKRSESVFKELERRNNELRSLESKYGPYSMHDGSGKSGKNPVGAKRVKVDALRSRAEEEKSKLEKAVSVTRTTSLNNLRMGLPDLLEAIHGFSSMCMNVFESTYNRAKDMETDGKTLLHR